VYSGTFNPEPAYIRNLDIALLNPHYIAIHAAIAEILHVSGAGIFFDRLLGKYKNDKDKFTLRSWPELEKERGKRR